MGKRVISTTEIPHEGRDGMDTTSHVLCTCKDGTIFEGSILVGADGSYSTVRKHMFLKLEELGELNPDDKGATLQPYQHCVVGVTEPLDPIEFEAINGHFSEFQVLRGRNNQHSVNEPLVSGFLFFLCSLCPKEGMCTYTRATEPRHCVLY